MSSSSSSSGSMSPEAARTLPLVRVLPETATDPFDTLPIPSVLSSGQTFGQFVYYKKQIDKSIPRMREAIIDLHPDQSAYLPGMLLWTATSMWALGARNKHTLQSVQLLRASMIKELRSIVERDAGTGDLLAGYGAIPTGMFILEMFLGEYAAAETHFRAVFQLSELRRSKGREILRLDHRNMLCHIGLWHAANRVRDTNPQLAQSITGAAFSYGFITDEYQTTAPLWNFVDSARNRRLLKWLISALRQERERKRSASAQSRILDADCEPPGDAELALVIRSFDGHGANISLDRGLQIVQAQPPRDDKWVWKLAVTTYALCTGTLGPVKELAGNEELTPAAKTLRELRIWADRAIEEWKRAPRVFEWSGREEVFGKLLWLMETEQGLDVLELIESESAVG